MSKLTEELRPTLALALPIIVAQVGQMLIGITDSAMIGRLGTVPLAASAFTNGVFGVFFVAGIGFLSPVGVFTARDHGANDLAGCAKWLKHGRVVAIAYGFGSFGLLALLSGQLHRFGQPPAVLAITPPFFLLIAASLIPTLFFQVQRQFAESLGHPWIPMLIMLGDVALNAGLNALFIWGGFGIPAFGLVGAGMATLLARTLAVVALAIWLRCSPALREVRAATAGDWSWKAFHALLAMGVPAAGALIFESGAFASAALMMGWIGATALAAHQVALSCAAFTFMFPLGLSIAVSMRVSKALGAGRRDLLRPIGFGALVVSTLLSLVFAAIFALGGGLLARGFSPDPAVNMLAAHLLLVAALFQVFDAGQVVGSGALRGLADVRVPTLLTFIAYWVLALPVGYFLAFRRDEGAMGIWTGLAIGLACAALLLWRRFDRLSRVLAHG
ncbi:MAG TPA: MATE family efflux transporter [Candidatus Didemnitutus sp.]|nr:MATE family efflux transporter [Candidatus Didemnitutus sp.]